MPVITRFVTLAVLVMLTVGCVSMREDYQPAGFNSWQDVIPYTTNYGYYATRLTQDEWQAFYRRFPDYWRDLNLGRTFGSTMEYHPWYTAYAFRWTTLQKKETWDSTTIERLQNKDIQPGDDVYKVIWALDAPDRVLFTNFSEALLYNNDTAIVMNGSHYKEKKPCKDCYKWPDQSSGGGLNDRQVEERLGIERPKY